SPRTSSSRTPSSASSTACAARRRSSPPTPRASRSPRWPPSPSGEIASSGCTSSTRCRSWRWSRWCAPSPRRTRRSGAPTPSPAPSARSPWRRKTPPASWSTCCSSPTSSTRSALRAPAPAQAHGARRPDRPQEREGLLRLFRRAAAGRGPRRLRPPLATPEDPTDMFGYDWPRLHAAVNDLPAALLLAAVCFDLGAWITRRDSLAAAALWTLWAGVIGGWLAVLAGLQAEDAIEHGEAIHDLMETHETLALVTMGLFTAVLAWRLA